MGRPRISPEKRTAIKKDINAGKPRNHIARNHHVSTGTVSNIAREINHEFDRAETKNATRARTEDARALRSELSLEMLHHARKLFQRLSSPYKACGVTKDGDYYEYTLPERPAADERNLAISVGVYMDKHVVLDRYDTDAQNLSAFDSWLASTTGEQP